MNDNILYFDFQIEESTLSVVIADHICRQFIPIIFNSLIIFRIMLKALYYNYRIQSIEVPKLDQIPIASK